MPLPPDLPVVDHHCHLSPSGEGVAAAQRFRAAGGTHLFLATQNYGPGVPATLDAYREQFHTTEELARKVGESAGVVAYPVLAPYPVDLVHVESTLGLSAATDLQIAALDLAAHEVEEHRAVALGEVGRPHFPVPETVREAGDSVLMHALEVARDVGCPVVVHSEDLDPEGFRWLAGVASRASFPLGRLVKHYARSIVPGPERLGIVPSFLARRELVRSSLAEPGPWFWETDFLDDPSRRGAVLDITTIPKRAHALAGDATAVEQLWGPFSKSIETVYGIALSPPTGARS